MHKQKFVTVRISHHASAPEKFEVFIISFVLIRIWFVDDLWKRRLWSTDFTNLPKLFSLWFAFLWTEKKSLFQRRVYCNEDPVDTKQPSCDSSTKPNDTRTCNSERDCGGKWFASKLALEQFASKLALEQFASKLVLWQFASNLALKQFAGKLALGQLACKLSYEQISNKLQQHGLLESYLF